MKAKTYLRGMLSTFQATKEEGGLVGSLRGLGFVVYDSDKYHITEEGKLWLEGKLKAPACGKKIKE